MSILLHGTWKNNIKSVNLDWRQRSAGHSSEGELSAGLPSEGREPLVTQADMSAPHLCSSAVALLHNKGPRHRRKICANSLWLYYYYTQSSLWKNKNINYIFIYLRVFRCLSSDAKCNICYLSLTRVRNGSFFRYFRRMHVAVVNWLFLATIFL